MQLLLLTTCNSLHEGLEYEERGGMLETSISPCELRILVVDDHPAIGFALRSLARNLPDCEVVGVLTDARRVMEETEVLRPDVVLMDIRLGGSGTGLNLAREIKERFPEIKVLMYSAYDDRPYVLAAREIGVDGYLLKSRPVESVIEAARSVIRGEPYWGPGVLDRLMPSAHGEGFTASEIEMLQLLAAGLGNVEIAKRLSTSRSGVGAHLKNVYSKLGVGNRTAAVVKAARLGLVVIEDAIVEKPE